MVWSPLPWEIRSRRPTTGPWCEAPSIRDAEERAPGCTGHHRDTYLRKRTSRPYMGFSFFPELSWGSGIYVFLKALLG